MADEDASVDLETQAMNELLKALREAGKQAARTNSASVADTWASAALKIAEARAWLRNPGQSH